MYSNHEIGPALFFVADGKLLFYTCSVEQGETGGDFVNYPYSHDAVWAAKHFAAYQVDYDYYPRGRVVYRKSDDTYLVYHDVCIADVAQRISALYRGKSTCLQLDEHYQCHSCNPHYLP